MQQPQPHLSMKPFLSAHVECETLKKNGENQTCFNASSFTSRGYMLLENIAFAFYPISRGQNASPAHAHVKDL